jgi:hypothetical protein
MSSISIKLGFPAFSVRQHAISSTNISPTDISSTVSLPCHNTSNGHTTFKLRRTLTTDQMTADEMSVDEMTVDRMSHSLQIHPFRLYFSVSSK